MKNFTNGKTLRDILEMHGRVTFRKLAQKPGESFYAIFYARGMILGSAMGLTMGETIDNLFNMVREKTFNRCRTIEDERQRED